MKTGESATLGVRLTNTGDTRWLTENRDQPGWTRLGAHLHGRELGTPALDYDWYRGELPHDVLPGQEVMLDVKLPRSTLLESTARCSTSSPSRSSGSPTATPRWPSFPSRSRSHRPTASSCQPLE